MRFVRALVGRCPPVRRWLRALSKEKRLESLELPSAMSRQAVRLLRAHGISAAAMNQGVPEWRVGGQVALATG